MALSEAQLKEIEGTLFLFRTPPPVLPRPNNTDDGTSPTHFTTRLKPVATNPRFVDISFGVVDFTADRMNPKVFLHKADTVWRMGSTGKIAALLAAAQLRDDVRKVKKKLDDLSLVLSPTQLDDLFATIWSRSKELRVRQIAGKDGSPRVSTIFDLSKPDPDFIGAPTIQKSLSRVDYPDPKTPAVPRDPWQEITKISFQDRLWLMGAQSDNTSAHSCISEIGVAYLKAVQKAYGLFLDDAKKGMRMLLGGGYFEDSPTTPVSTAPGAPKYRTLRNYEKQWVKDEYADPVDPHLSWQGGSVRALTAYMIALIQDKLVDADGCVQIKKCLADGLPPPAGFPDTLPGSLLQGVQDTGVKIVEAHGKGGALSPKQGAKRPLRCDVAHIKTGGSAPREFAIVAQGLLPFGSEPVTIDPDDQGRDLAKAIHAALIAP